MNEIVKTAMLIAVLVLTFFPWVIGVIDVLSWALFGRKVTNIPWSTGRGALLAMWPILFIAVTEGAALMVRA